MWLPVLGLILGLLLGTVFTFEVPVYMAKYLSIAVLAALDSLLGACRALLEKKFDNPILVTGFFTNILLAAVLAYIGDLLGIDLYLAAVIAFGLRIFSNLSYTRRHLVSKYRKWYRRRMAEAHRLAPEEEASHTSVLESGPILSSMDEFAFESDNTLESIQAVTDDSMEEFGDLPEEPTT